MEYSNILIIKMSSLGDVLHTLPFVAVLRRRYPKAKLTWLVHPQFAGFVPDPPLIDQVIYFDKARFNKMGWRDRLSYFMEMRRTLQAQHFDLVIDMQGLFKSAVMAAISGCSNRIGYCEMREGSGLISRAIVGAHSKDHVIERYLDVARYLGATVDSIDFPMPDLTGEWQAVAARLGAAATKPYIVLVPGARWVTKVWPAENYAKLAALLLAEGVQVVLAGGPAEARLGQDIIKEKAALDGKTEGAVALSLLSVKELQAQQAASKKRGRLVNLIGQTNLRQLGALIQHSSGYISGDTGPLFIAAAMKKPLVALYGPTKPDRTGPYGSEASVILQAPVPCAGCLRKKCDNWLCMKSLTPERVFAEYKKWGVMNGGAES